MSYEVFFFYLQFGSKYLCHAHIIMHSRIWFKLSDRGATLSHVTRKVTQNTRPSFSSFSDVQQCLGMRPILEADLIDTWYRFALRLPGLHPGLPTTHGLLPSFSSFQCLGLHVFHAVPWLLALFLLVEQPLMHSKVHNHPAHSTLASNSATLLPLALENANHEAQILA